MHHQTAKKAKGFSDAHARFWAELFELVQRFDVRIISGDFNMSVYIVVSTLRRLGLVIDVAALYPWRTEDKGELRSDSCGIFLIGGCRTVQLHYPLQCFSETEAASSHGDAVTLDKFRKGQGYPLNSYLPKKPEEFVETLNEMFSPSINRQTEAASSHGDGCAANGSMLEKWKQKRIKIEMFDPNGVFFSTGAHMPLLGFLGNITCRSEAKLLEREIKRKEKLRRKMADRKSDKGAGRGKGKPVPRADSSHGDGESNATVQRSEEGEWENASWSSSGWTYGWGADSQQWGWNNDRSWWSDSWQSW